MYQVGKIMKRFSAIISLKMMIFLIRKKDTARGGGVHEQVIKMVNGIAP